VPDDAFTVDSQAPTSFDTYGTNLLSEPIDGAVESDLVVDLTEKLRTEPVENNEFAEAPDVDAAPLPPIENGVTDYDYSNKINEITLELINEEAVDSSTSAPVLFTYPPETEGPTTTTRADRFARFAKGLSQLSDKRLYYKLLINDFYSQSEDKLFGSE
jgi:hypothetical protein